MKEKIRYRQLTKREREIGNVLVATQILRNIRLREMISSGAVLLLVARIRDQTEFVYGIEGGLTALLPVESEFPFFPRSFSTSTVAK